MADAHQLPYLLALLDDPTPAVREPVLQALADFGTGLADALRTHGSLLTPEQERIITPLLEPYSRRWLQERWASWMRQHEDKAKLERALTLLADFQSNRIHAISLPNLLDQLAEEFRSLTTCVNVHELARFLFHDYGLGGVPQEAYYLPHNSNLVYVIEHKRGIPVSLACIYILVGYRLGLAIEGCNFPGHFLAIALLHRERVLVDCFNGGRFIDQNDLRSINAAISIKDILRLECRAPVIIARVLQNLMNAYEQTGARDNEQLMRSLHADLQSNLPR